MTIESFFDGISSDVEQLFTPRREKLYRVAKSGDDVLIELDVPGSSPEDVSVHVDGSELHVDWKRKLQGSELTGSQTFKLSPTTDFANIEAKVEHGMLTIKVPRRVSQPKKIQIKMT